ncbi:MAG: outer membrane beta-barrel protein [Deltaproteobacteria bacterium]|nr:outer membrane beta-barrel protein [Deltaproteobacteria bacterium]
MKRTQFIVALACVALVAGAAQAEEKYVGGGFEASGSVVTGAGFQHNTANVVDAGTMDDDGAISGFGVLGNYYGVLPAAKQDNWRFFVDSVELDLMKSFGENIRFRADLDFGRAASGSSAAFLLEQAYATANIPAGNGIEFLLGRFNAPIGFDSVDVADSTLISQTFLVRSGVRPTNVTGGKFYYAFNDSVDFHFYLANQFFGDTADQAGKEYPGGGLRLGYNWGDEGTESTVGFSAFGATEGALEKNYSFAGDVDFNWWVNESFAVGGEVLFRRDPAATTGGSKQETLSGLVNLNYAFSDVWDGTFRYNYTKQYDSTPATRGAGAATSDFLGFEGSAHEASLGVGYAVADGAWLRFEGRFDWLKAAVKGYDYGAAVAFAYNF